MGTEEPSLFALRCWTCVQVAQGGKEALLHQLDAGRLAPMQDGGVGGVGGWQEGGWAGW